MRMSGDQNLRLRGSRPDLEDVDSFRSHEFCHPLGCQQYGSGACADAPPARSGTEQPGLLEDVVGQRKHIRRDVEIQHLGGLQVENQFDLGRLFDRNVCWLGAFEYLVDKVAGAAE